MEIFARPATLLWNFPNTDGIRKINSRRNHGDETARNIKSNNFSRRRRRAREIKQDPTGLQWACNRWETSSSWSVVTCCIGKEAEVYRSNPNQRVTTEQIYFLFCRSIVFGKIGISRTKNFLNNIKIFFYYFLIFFWSCSLRVFEYSIIDLRKKIDTRFINFFTLVNFLNLTIFPHFSYSSAIDLCWEILRLLFVHYERFIERVFRFWRSSQ